MVRFGAEMGSPVQSPQQPDSDDARQNLSPSHNWQHISRRIPKSPHLTLTHGEAITMPFPHSSARSSSVSDFREPTSHSKIHLEKITDEQTPVTPDAVSVKRTAQEGIRAPVLHSTVRGGVGEQCYPVPSSNDAVRDSAQSSSEAGNKPDVVFRNDFSKSSAVMLPGRCCKTQSAETSLNYTPSNLNPVTKTQLVQLASRKETCHPQNPDLCYILNRNQPRSSPCADVAIDFEKARSLVREALEVSSPKPSISVPSPVLNRVANIDPSYPPPPPEIQEFNTRSEEHKPELHGVEEGPKIKQPFDVYNPAENVLQEIVHTEVETYQPAWACPVSELLANQAKKGTNMNIVSFVETLRTKPDESSKLVERAVQDVLDSGGKEQKRCQRCETNGFSELVKHSIYSELRARVATRHPWLAEDIADVLMDGGLLEVLHLLLHPNLLLQAMMETFNEAVKLLNARQRRKVLRQNMTIRLQAIQSEKHHKVLAIIMRGKDTALLNMLSYPELLESRAREALFVVRLNEDRARLKRNVRKQEMTQADLSTRPSAGWHNVVAGESSYQQSPVQHSSDTPGRKLTVPGAAVPKTAVPAVKRRRIGDD